MILKVGDFYGKSKALAAVGLGFQTRPGNKRRDHFFFENKGVTRAKTE